MNMESFMKMRKFSLNKLWRDKAPENHEKSGSIIHVTILDDVQYRKALGLKLIEEAHEVATATSQDDLISELADIREVTDCIMKLHNISLADVTKRQEKKRHERGSFLERKFVTIAEYQPGSFGEKYALNDLARHPEIFDGDEPSK